MGSNTELFTDDKGYREQEERHLLLLVLCQSRIKQAAELERIYKLKAHDAHS